MEFESLSKAPVVTFSKNLYPHYIGLVDGGMDSCVIYINYFLSFTIKLKLFKIKIK